MEVCGVDGTLMGSMGHSEYKRRSIFAKDGENSPNQLHMR